MIDAVDALEPRPNPNKTVVKSPPPRNEVSRVKDVGPEARSLERDLSAVVRSWPEYQQAVVDRYERVMNGDGASMHDGIIFTRGDSRYWVKRANRGGTGKREIREISIKVRGLDKPQLVEHQEAVAFELGDPPDYADRFVEISAAGEEARSEGHIKKGLGGDPFSDPVDSSIRCMDEKVHAMVRMGDKVQRRPQANTQAAVDGAQRWAAELLIENQIAPPAGIRNVTPQTNGS